MLSLVGVRILLAGRGLPPLGFYFSRRDIVSPVGGPLVEDREDARIPSLLNVLFIVYCPVCLLSCQSHVLSVRTSHSFHPVVVLVFRVRSLPLPCRQGRGVRNTALPQRKNNVIFRMASTAGKLQYFTPYRFHLCPQNVGAVPAGVGSTKVTVIANRANSDQRTTGLHLTTKNYYCIDINTR